MIISVFMNIELNKVFFVDVGSDFVLFLVKLLCTSLSHTSDLISPKIPICSIGNLHNSFKKIKKFFGIPSSPIEPDISKQKSIPSSSSSPFPMLVAKKRKPIGGTRYLIADDLKVMILSVKCCYDLVPENEDCVWADIEFGQEEAVVFMNAMLKSRTVLTDTFGSAAAAKIKAKETDAEATNTVLPAIS